MLSQRMHARPFASRAPAARGIRRTLAVTPKANLRVGQDMAECPEYYRVLPSSQGGSVAISSFRGKQPVVLFFYPKAGTPGCTKEACKFRDEYMAFEQRGAVVFGISGDSPAENKAFAESQNLPFPLLTDPSNILRKVFGIKGELLGLLPGRQTYVISKEGKLVMIFNDMMNAEMHVTKALEALQSLPVAVKA